MNAKRKTLQKSAGFFYVLKKLFCQSYLVENFKILITLRQTQCDK